MKWLTVCAELRPFCKFICLYVSKAWWFLVFIPHVFTEKTISSYDKNMIRWWFWIKKKIWLFKFPILCFTANILHASQLVSCSQGVRTWAYCICLPGKNSICLPTAKGDSSLASMVLQQDNDAHWFWEFSCHEMAKDSFSTLLQEVSPKSSLFKLLVC